MTIKSADMLIIEGTGSPASLRSVPIAQVLRDQVEYICIDGVGNDARFYRASEDINESE